jgi:kynurenine 3-monooxygenase
MESDQIVVVGAGLVGSLLATSLQLKGYKVSLYERWGDIRAQTASSGRSINLVATARGLRALDTLPPELRASLLELGTRVTGRIIHSGGDGDEPIFQRYGKDDTEFNYSISRLELNKFLLNEAEKAGAHIHFNHALVDSDFAGEYPTLTFDVDSSAESPPQLRASNVVVSAAGPVIAADGGGSAVRRALKAAGLCEYDEIMLDSGYKEMTFPKAAAEAGGMAGYGLHIWPCGEHMIMGLANLDGSFTGTIYMDNEKGEESFAKLESGGPDAARAFLEKHYATALPLLGGGESAGKQLAHNGRGILGTVRTKQWVSGKKVCLIGDAAHAIVPFFGQGMNSGFEDVKAMIALLSKHAPSGGAKDYVAAFAAFEAERKPNADAIADMALENYVEMRASTGDPSFRKIKAVENALENSVLGSTFRSRYAMVCYGGAGNVSYAAAQKLGKVQWEIVSELAEQVSSVEAAASEIDLERAKQLLESKLAPLQRELRVDLSTVRH